MSSIKKNQGFTLIELLIVVAIIGIIAAIAIPSLLRARVSANEAASIGDSRTVSSAETAYQSSAGGAYGSMTCLSTPSGGCINNYDPTSPTFLDPAIAAGNQVNKGGYSRNFYANTNMTTPLAFTADNYAAFCYESTPITFNQTGVRGFGIDSSGRVCQDPTATSANLCGGAETLLPACTVLQ